jgi:hypothetical protein
VLFNHIPYDNEHRSSINGTHLANLLIPVDNVFLVDTQLIYPKVDGRISRSRIAQSRKQIGGDRHGTIVAIDGICSISIVPTVRQRHELHIAVSKVDLL